MPTPMISSDTPMGMSNSRSPSGSRFLMAERQRQPAGGDQPGPDHQQDRRARPPVQPEQVSIELGAPADGHQRHHDSRR